MAETREMDAAAKPQPVTIVPNLTAQFEPDPAQEEWVKNDHAQARAADGSIAARQKKIAESGIMFHNIPGSNEQFIGYVDKSIPVQENGVTTSSIRSVPLGPEAFSAGREVRWPDGSRSVLPVGITSAEQIVHPETGEPLIEPVTAAEIKAAGEEDVRDGGALGADETRTRTATKTTTRTAARK